MIIKMKNNIVAFYSLLQKLVYASNTLLNFHLIMLSNVQLNNVDDQPINLIIQMEMKFTKSLK